MGVPALLQDEHLVPHGMGGEWSRGLGSSRGLSGGRPTPGAPNDPEAAPGGRKQKAHRGPMQPHVCHPRTRRLGASKERCLVHKLSHQGSQSSHLHQTHVCLLLREHPVMRLLWTFHFNAHSALNIPASLRPNKTHLKSDLESENYQTLWGLDGCNVNLHTKHTANR